jgi:hypothetical protein
VNRMVPRPRVTMRRATSRPLRKPLKQAISQILWYLRAIRYAATDQRCLEQYLICFFPRLRQTVRPAPRCQDVKRSGNRFASTAV